ncbi:MAG: DNA polymerase IV [Bacteroidetes bacterium]|nr:DNA polymerase IV [Bacteroidota bacterium]
MRKILHIDMDAFYTSVEQRDNPELRGKPVAVGGTSKRGVVAAASYEARAFGVRSAMPSSVAARKCPDLIFVKTRFDVYKAVSKELRGIFKRYTDLVEPLSLDEAYLDVSEPKISAGSATSIAREIKKAILKETELTASAGVSFNKFLAKLGSDFQKPDGLTVITPANASAFIERLPIEKFYGIGPVTAGRMHDIGVQTGGDLLRLSEDELAARFGKSGRYYYKMARCEDDREVKPSRERKSVGAERTFEEDISDVGELLSRLDRIADSVAERLAQSGVAGHTVTLKIKYHDFEVNTRQMTSKLPVGSREELIELGDLLLRNSPAPPKRPVRLLGLSVSKLCPINGGPAEEQLALDFRGDAGAIG